MLWRVGVSETARRVFAAKGGLALIALDLSVAQWAAHLGGHSAVFDGLLNALTTLPTFKIFPLVALLCAAAIRQKSREDAMGVLVGGIIPSALALMTARLVQNLAPPRPRPAFTPGFELSTGVDIAPDWSSFPSDTAALAMALTVVIWRYSQPLGMVAASWTCLICAARVVGGYHYPSDVLAGFGIGVSAALFVPRSGVLARTGARLSQRATNAAPTLFGVFLLFTMFQLGTMFFDIRQSSHGFLKSVGVIREQKAPADPAEERLAQLPALADKSIQVRE